MFYLLTFSTALHGSNVNATEWTEWVRERMEDSSFSVPRLPIRNELKHKECAEKKTCYTWVKQTLVLHTILLREPRSENRRGSIAVMQTETYKSTTSLVSLRIIQSGCEEKSTADMFKCSGARVMRWLWWEVKDLLICPLGKINKKDHIEHAELIDGGARRLRWNDLHNVIRFRAIWWARSNDQKSNFSNSKSKNPNQCYEWNFFVFKSSPRSVGYCM